MHVGTIMESKDATFFGNIFHMRDETSSSRQEFIEDDSSIERIEHNEPTLVENSEEDNNDALRKSKRQRTISLLVMISLYALWIIHPEPSKRHIHLLMLTIGRKQ